jgi:hypothetical protein
MAMEPVALQDFFVAVVSGAAVIITGAAYALLFAAGRVYGRTGLLPFAYLAYVVLAVAVLTLSRTLHFSGSWRVLTYLLLFGYLFAPHGIWHLSVATHQAGRDEAE